jgi:hypothetical protein
MTVPLRLGLFVLGLLAVFAVSFGVGRLTGPAVPADTGHEMSPGPAVASDGGHTGEDAVPEENNEHR